MSFVACWTNAANWLMLMSCRPGERLRCWRLPFAVLASSWLVSWACKDVFSICSSPALMGVLVPLLLYDDDIIVMSGSAAGLQRHLQMYSCRLATKIHSCVKQMANGIGDALKSSARGHQCSSCLPNNCRHSYTYYVIRLSGFRACMLVYECAIDLIP